MPPPARGRAALAAQGITLTAPPPPPPPPAAPPSDEEDEDEDTRRLSSPRRRDSSESEDEPPPPKPKGNPGLAPAVRVTDETNVKKDENPEKTWKTKYATRFRKTDRVKPKRKGLKDINIDALPEKKAFEQLVDRFRDKSVRQAGDDKKVTTDSKALAKELAGATREWGLVDEETAALLKLPHSDDHGPTLEGLERVLDLVSDGRTYCAACRTLLTKKDLSCKKCRFHVAKRIVPITHKKGVNLQMIPTVVTADASILELGMMVIPPETSIDEKGNHLPVPRPPPPIAIGYVEPQGWADSQGLETGDLIVAINGVDLINYTYDEVFETLKSSKRPLTMEVLQMVKAQKRREPKKAQMKELEGLKASLEESFRNADLSDQRVAIAQLLRRMDQLEVWLAEKAPPKVKRRIFLDRQEAAKQQLLHGAVPSQMQTKGTGGVQREGLVPEPSEVMPSEPSSGFMYARKGGASQGRPADWSAPERPRVPANGGGTGEAPEELGAPTYKPHVANRAAADDRLSKEDLAQLRRALVQKEENVLQPGWL